MSSHPQRTISLYVFLILPALIWGGNAVAGKLAVGHISPFLLTTMRWFFACALLLPFVLHHLKRDAGEIRKHVWFLALMGAMGFAVFNNLLYLALTYTSAINVAIEQSAMPLFVFLLNYALYRTRVTALQIIGFVISLAGVVVTVTHGNPFGLLNSPLNRGDLLMMFAALAYSAYSVLVAKKPAIHLLSFIFVAGSFAFLTSLPFAAWELGHQTLNWPDMTGWGVVLFTAIFPSLIAQAFWVMGIEGVGSNRGGLFINLVPIFAAFLAVLILGEKFQMYHAAGLALVMGGIALAERARPSAEQR